MTASWFMLGNSSQQLSGNVFNIVVFWKYLGISSQSFSTCRIHYFDTFKGVMINFNIINC